MILACAECALAGRLARSGGGRPQQALRRREDLNLRIAIVGAGIVGVTTAYELALAGHEVTVFEQRGSVASEGSFANAGLLAAGDIAPWCGPGVPWRVLRQLLQHPGHGATAAGRVPWRSCRGCGGPGAPVGRASTPGQRLAMHRLAQFSRSTPAGTDTHACAWSSSRPQATWCCCAAKQSSGRRSRAWHLLREWGVAHEMADLGTLPSHRTWIERSVVFARRHLLCARRRGQLPPVCPSAEGRGAAPGRALPCFDDAGACHPCPVRRSRWNLSGLRPGRLESFDAHRRFAPGAAATAIAQAAWA